MLLDSLSLDRYESLSLKYKSCESCKEEAEAVNSDKNLRSRVLAILSKEMRTTCEQLLNLKLSKFLFLQNLNTKNSW